MRLQSGPASLLKLTLCKWVKKKLISSLELSFRIRRKVVTRFVQTLGHIIRSLCHNSAFKLWFKWPVIVKEKLDLFSAGFRGVCGWGYISLEMDKMQLRSVLAWTIWMFNYLQRAFVKVFSVWAFKWYIPNMCECVSPSVHRKWLRISKHIKAWSFSEAADLTQKRWMCSDNYNKSNREKKMLGGTKLIFTLWVCGCILGVNSLASIFHLTGVWEI